MDDKDQMRRALAAQRSAHHKAHGEAEAQALAEFVSSNADKQLGAISDKIIAAYLPMGGELDPRPLMQALRKNGNSICLPVCINEDAPLVFRRYRHNDALLPDDMGIAAPRATAQQVTPDIVLLPLLAFDGQGHRLGRGGGFYDRTLAELKKRSDCRFIGLAFDMQMVDKCPIAPHDEALHAVLTPSKRHDFNRD
ncbi:5-formyltetrahydrofolate cyclo-ligase [Alphaproteobacteria bacterium]|jgi:5-formyltetrahydrofolate cyclo-ligase|nr:5-formyltetrahydrofolate cyclo-ligase [Alphaproteobacteria bacterium]MDA8539210.1 5-formyltetrahydrofolate cyclo-ligase [Alphaproteobacteria bacterium]MDA8624119.1 5-formyltetrahydrofolate cyclo-ligase [Alphaproteobacteria bacterium]MDA8726354.1 5-formyltetrahydrofolate cyclo-ligase [Alphaproteobacteria bacterium]MDA8780383.1 5-formyltetrahydrofolate cyclo-ligase [Alphaproteobacteria bacterium]